MIQVPARVKDALKSGDYKKNYKISVHRIVPAYEEQVRSISVERINGNSFSGTYDFTGFTAGDVFKFKYPASGAFSRVTIFITGQAPISLDAITSYTETYVQLTYSSNYNNATFEFSNVSFIPEEIDTGSFEVWKKIDEKTEDFVIDNNHLVAESVKFDERMCSDTVLKFGLCEGTSVEFQYFDFPNIRGQHININLDVEYKNALGNIAWYTIPMGQFDVDECSRQASTGIIKATAYNKLKSAYLDEDINGTLKEIVDEAGSSGVTLGQILHDLLDGYGISHATEIRIYPEPGHDYIPSEVPARYVHFHAWGIPKANSSGRIYDGKRMVVLDLAIDVPLKNFTYADENYYNIDIYESSSTMVRSWYMDRIRAAGTDLDQLVWDEYSGDSKTLLNYMATDHGDFTYCDYFSGVYEITYFNNGDWDRSLSRKFFFKEPSSGYQYYHTGYRNHFSLINEKCLYTVHCPIAIYELELNATQKALDLSHRLAANINVDYVIEREGYQSTMDTVGRNQVFTYSTTYVGYSPDMTGTSTEILYPSDVDSLTQSVTLRELQSAAFEIDCLYGKLDRVTDLFSGIELNQGHLFPSDYLFPANDLYPQGTSESSYPAMYSKLWADEGNVRSFRTLYVTYKTTENNEVVEKVIQRVVNSNGTDDYIMDDNWLFKNLVWTTADVGAYADAMVAKMQNIKWFPFEMWCAGLPYLESGDMIEIKMKGGTYPSYVLRRVLDGIQNLQDEMINGTLDIF